MKMKKEIEISDENNKVASEYLAAQVSEGLYKNSLKKICNELNIEVING